MKIKDENGYYVLLIKDVYMDKDGNIVEEILELDKWAEIVSKKAISVLYYMEEFLSDKLGQEIKLSEDCPQIRKPLLNLSGCIKRLPENLIIKVSDENL